MKKHPLLVQVAMYDADTHTLQYNNILSQCTVN
jgi:hypothetical protein